MYMYIAYTHQDVLAVDTQDNGEMISTDLSMKERNSY